MRFERQESEDDASPRRLDSLNELRIAASRRTVCLSLIISRKLKKERPMRATGTPSSVTSDVSAAETVCQAHSQPSDRTSRLEAA